MLRPCKEAQLDSKSVAGLEASFQAAEIPHTLLWLERCPDGACFNYSDAKVSKAAQRVVAERITQTVINDDTTYRMRLGKKLARNTACVKSNGFASHL